MRMGQGENKGKRSRQKKPLFQVTTIPQNEVNVGGPISANLIESLYEEAFTKIANQQAELHAQELLKEDDLSTTENTTTINSEENQKGFHSYLFASTETREEFLILLSETSNHFSTVGKSVPKWKVHANAAKFERLLNEKYGRLRPFMTKYPQIETYLRNTQRKYNRGEFSPFRQGPAPIDKKASIILLVIMQRNGARMETIFFTGLFFLVGLQPWALIALVVVGRFLVERRKKRKVDGWLVDEVKPVKSYYAESIKSVSQDEETLRKVKNDILLKPVGEPISSTDLDEGACEKYDTLVVGSGPSSLYTAALLSRTGRTVLVLSPDVDASGCRIVNNSNISSKTMGEKGQHTDIPFDIHSNNVARTSAQQPFLAPALSSETDCQGGIRFAQIGSECDGFTSDILSIPGMGVDNYKDSSPYLIRAGGALSIAQDAATLLGDAWPNENDVGDSSSAAYLTLCTGINATAREFYLSKLMPEKINKMKKSQMYQEAGIRYASGFLDKGLPLNPHVRSLMAGIGMRGENLPPSKTSMAAHVSNISACVSTEGFSYPIGGPRALCHAFASVIQQNGGKVFTGVDIKEFLFDEVKEEVEEEEKVSGSQEQKESKESIIRPHCYGVKLDNGRCIVIGTHHEESCVISMLGFIETFIFKMSDDIRSRHGLPIGLPALSERRPTLKFLFCLDGNSDELSLTGADWYRLPNASIPFDEKNPETGEVTPGHIGMRDDDDEEVNEMRECDNVNIDNNGDDIHSKRSKDSHSSRKKSRRVEYLPGFSWMKVSFPSAKDPSWKERHNGVSTCVVTIEAGSNHVRMFDTTPRIYSAVKCSPIEGGLLVKKVLNDLIQNFPQLTDKITYCEMIGPIREGLSHDPQRYAAKGIRPETPYPGLYVGGSDLTVGDSFSGSIVGGWLVSNAVLGYSFSDHLFLDKNVTNDITQCLKGQNTHSETEDIAVPFLEEP